MHRISTSVFVTLCVIVGKPHLVRVTVPAIQKSVEVNVTVPGIQKSEGSLW